MNNQKVSRPSLERIKIDYCRYEYFIADDNGNRIMSIDPKYYNCREVGKEVNYMIEYELDENDNNVKKQYDTGFRFYEFSYNVNTPTFQIAYQTKEDNWGQYREPIPIDEWCNNDDRDIEIEEKEGEEVVLKAIIDDTGKLIIDGVIEIVEYINQLQTFIVKLKIYKNCRWQEEFINALGEDKHLWAVVDSNGNFLFKPYRSVIKYSSSFNLFEVAGIVFYDEKGSVVNDLK